jgi:ribosomal protein L11 methyltransferase
MVVDVVSTEVADDWSERWREFHHPLDVGPLRVRPPWEPARPGALDVVIDPGRAFGTGAHASTRLALELLVGLPAEGALADWGCGSGVLAIAAARLGFAPVTACDMDADSVAATEEAATAHGVDVAVSRCDLRSGSGPPAATVTANLVRPLLLDVAAAMDAPPQRLIASGLETGEADEVAGAFARCGLRLEARRDGDGWSAILLVR